jgi:hypothetical protein
MRLWMWIGVAGLAGVAATGAVVARNERQRRAYTPDDVRSRLHERAAAIEHDATVPAPGPLTNSSPPAQRPAGRWSRLRPYK